MDRVRTPILYSLFMAIICEGSQSVRSDQVDASVGESGKWGDWSNAIYCNDGYFGTGFKLKIDSYHNSFTYDNTAANAFRMICDDGNELNAGNDGPDGSWSSTVSCPSNTYITAIKDKFQDSVGTFGDDTALNGIRVLCTGDDKDTTFRDAYDEKGDWSWYSYCSVGASACGFRQRVEGSVDDDTALNAVQIYCCSDKEEEKEYSFSDITGEWVHLATCLGGGTCWHVKMISITHLESSEVTTAFEDSLTHTAGISMEYKGAGASYELSSTASKTVTDSTIRSISQTIETEFRFICEAEDDVMYQWITGGTAISTGLITGETKTTDFVLDSTVWACVSDINLGIPKCPPNYCADEDCQECSSFGDETPSPTTKPTPKPTAKPTTEATKLDTKGSNTGAVIAVIVAIVVLIIACIVVICCIRYCVKGLCYMMKCGCSCCDKTNNDEPPKQESDTGVYVTPHQQTQLQVLGTPTTTSTAQTPVSTEIGEAFPTIQPNTNVVVLVPSNATPITPIN